MLLWSEWLLKGRHLPHLETLVGRDDGSFVVDWRDVDVDDAGQTVLPDFRLIGHNCKAVLLSFTAVVNVGDVLSFHLETKTKKKKQEEKRQGSHVGRHCRRGRVQTKGGTVYVCSF